MKKIIYAYIVILISVFAILSFLDINGEYPAEKAMWKINQQFKTIIADPKAAPPATYKQVTDEYKRFIERFPNSQLVPLAHLFLGRISMVREDYKGAREKFESIVNNYSKENPVGLEALSEIVRSYTLEKDPVNILKTYHRIEQDYPLSGLGLHVPILIAKFHMDQKNTEQAKVALASAIDYYRKMINQYPKSLVEYNSLRLLATCYMAKKRWSDAVNTFGDLLIKYPDPRNTGNIVKAINTVSIKNMGNFDLPISIYEKFIKTYPDHPFNEPLTEVIEKIKELKKQNVDEATKNENESQK